MPQDHAPARAGIHLQVDLQLHPEQLFRQVPETHCLRDPLDGGVKFGLAAG